MRHGGGGEGMERRRFTNVLGTGILGAKILGAGRAATPGQARMAKPIKACVITHRQGAHLSHYFAALAEAGEVAEVALSDPGGDTTQDARRALGEKLTSVYTSPEEMLAKEKPVIALVSMEAGFAPPAIGAALEAGCHVMAEKPACLRAEDFEKLTRQANSNNLLLMLALANRLNPEVREARRLIQEGRIGKIYGSELHLIADQTRLSRPGYQQSWYAQKARGAGGHLIWLGIHWIDLVMYLTGSSIVEVAGVTGVVGGQPLDVEDSAALAVRFDNGTLGTVTSGYYLDKGYHSHIKIWGSKGWLQIERHGGSPLRWYSTADGAGDSTGDGAPKVREYKPPEGPTGYSPFVASCVRASMGLQPPPLTADESLRALKTVFASYRAAETGRSQRIV